MFAHSYSEDSHERASPIYVSVKIIRQTIAATIWNVTTQRSIVNLRMVFVNELVFGS